MHIGSVNAQKIRLVLKKEIYREFYTVEKKTSSPYYMLTHQYWASDTNSDTYINFFFNVLIHLQKKNCNSINSSE